MNWLEIAVNTKTEEIDTLCDALEELGAAGFIIDDEAAVRDFMQNEQKYWDYIDDCVLASVAGICRVRFFLEDSDTGYTQLEAFKAALPAYAFAARRVRDEDWENNWRAFYKPMDVGEKLRIVPEWEVPTPSDVRTVLRLDPGLIFGTGSHATTRMCLEALEAIQPKTVLDLGCGSGILSIAALLLGAETAFGCDIDEKAPRIVMENASLNGVERQLRVVCGDVLSDAALQGEIQAKRYDLILANIVADVILALIPYIGGWLAPGGLFVCSGIIEGRQEEIEKALSGAGLIIKSARTKEGWHCYSAGF